MGAVVPAGCRPTVWLKSPNRQPGDRRPPTADNAAHPCKGLGLSPAGRVQPGSWIAVMLGDEPTRIRLVAADRVAQRPQRLFNRFGYHTDTARTVSVAQHEFRPRPFVFVTG